MKPILVKRTLVVGALMGVAEVIPGVSGGTIAFLSGLYLRMLSALAMLPAWLKQTLVDRQFKSAWQRADILFLVILFGSMLSTAMLVSGLIRTALAEYPIPLWSLFTGMIWVSAMVMLAGDAEKSIRKWLWVAFGLVLSTLIQFGLSSALEVSAITLLIAGAVAVSAWVLPGISGSLILLLLGLYPTVIRALSELDLTILAPLALGCAAGLLVFAKLLESIYERYRSETVWLLSGVLIGSLVRLWPWQSIQSYQLRDNGETVPILQFPVLPWEYEGLTGQDSQLLIALCMMIVGGFMVWGLHRRVPMGSVGNDETQ